MRLRLIGIHLRQLDVEHEARKLGGRNDAEAGERFVDRRRRGVAGAVECQRAAIGRVEGPARLVPCDDRGEIRLRREGQIDR